MVLNFKQIYSDSWNVFKKNWWELIVVTLIMAALTFIPLIGNFLQLFMYCLILNAILKSAKGEEIKFSDFFQFKEIANTKIITILIVIALLGLFMQAISDEQILAGILTLVVLVITVLIFPLFCVMIDKNLSIKETITDSFNLTKGARFDIIIFLILNFIITVLGVILLFVGIFVAIPIVTIATVFTYIALKNKAL
ncbi:MAG: hypothetical protein II816_06440 [Elusimicrobia bacterium]|nr:hypothetical protein [Elusimicrobiota bacterium]